MNKEYNAIGEKPKIIKSEVEIDLRDMICYCFLHWRSAIAIMIVFGIIFGGYSTLKNYSAEKAVVDAYSRYDAAVADGVKDDTKLRVAVGNDTVYTNIKAQNKITSLNSQIAELNEDISKKEAYLNNAEIMKIDPNKEYYAKTLVVITIPDTSKSGTLSSIMDAYESNLLSQECKDKISSETGIKSRYIHDLIDISASTDDATEMDKTGTVGTLTISAIGKSESDIKSMASDVIANLENVNSKISETFGDYSTKVMDTNYGITADNNITEQADDINTKIATDRTSLTQIETTLSTLTATPRPIIEKSVLVKSFIKKSVTGAIIVFLLYGLLLCIIYAVSGGAITKTQFIARYKLFELGTFADAGEKVYRRNGAFDKWLRKRMDISEKSEDRAAVCDMIAANLRVYASDKINIIITGAAAMDEKVELIEELRTRNSNVAFLSCESITNNADDRSKMASADGVILFEKYGVSKYRDMNQEIMFVSDAGIDVIGYISE